MRRAGGQSSHRGALICEDLPQISLVDLRKRGALKPGSYVFYDLRDYFDCPDGIGFIAHDGYAEIHRYDDGEWLGGPQRIEFARSRVAMTSSHRLWFQGCASCDRRHGILYVDGYGPIKCRLCLRANHAVTGLKSYERARHRALKIRHRLAELNGIEFDPDNQTFPPRPKWQHRRTYDRLRAKHDTLMEQHKRGALAQACSS
jgi:hypothetical protein